MTKDGDFVLNKAAALASNNQIINGVPTGAIRLDPTKEFEVDEMGNVYQENEFITQMGVVDVEDYNYIEKYGENLYQLVNGGTIINSGAKVNQGSLEMSNVNVVYEMVEMIATTRSYEANQKIIQTIDETLDKAVNSIGSL